MFLVVMGALWFIGLSAGSGRPAKTATTTTTARVVSPPPAHSKSPTRQPAMGSRNVGETTSGLPQGYVISETILPAPLDPSVSYLSGKLFITSVRRDVRAGQEYVVVQASSKNTYDIPITGLMLKSKVTTLEGKIPKGWSFPSPTNQGEGEVVMLRPGERAYVISGRSPNGQSFQQNTCTGYFEQGMNFTPPLPLQCPRPIDEPRPTAPNTLSDTCLDYLKQLPRCQVPPFTVPTKLRADGNCQAFLFNKINYNQCVTNHRNERGFFKGEWHLYLNRNTRLWESKREIIELLDENGRVVDRETLR